MFQLPVSQPDDLLDGFDDLRKEIQEMIMRQLEGGRPVGDHHRLAVWTVVQLGEVSIWPRRCWSCEREGEAEGDPRAVGFLGEGGPAQDWRCRKTRG